MNNDVKQATWKELTRAQKMELGWRVVCDERDEQGNVQAFTKNKILRNNLEARGFIAHTGSGYEVDHILTEKALAVQDLLREYYRKHEKVETGLNLTQEEWQSWAG